MNRGLKKLPGTKKGPGEGPWGSERLGQRRGVAADWQWETFAEQMPVSEYGDWRGPVDRARESGGNALIQSPVVRYQPTSGSTSAIKWIPYTRQFLSELDIRNFRCLVVLITPTAKIYL